MENKPKRGRPKKSAVQIGIDSTIRTTSKRIIADNISKTQLNPLIKIGLIAALTAVLSHVINKK